MGFGEVIAFSHRRNAVYLCVLAATLSVLVAQLASPSSASAGKGRGGSLVTFEGYGAAHWGEQLPAVERALAVGFDCSGGAIPGVCLCPVSEPALPVVLVFDVSGTPRLASLWTQDSTVRTARGIHVGSTPAEVVHAYPSARLRHNGIGGGLGIYYLVRRDHHAMAFLVTGDKIRAIYAFADPHRNSIASESCA